MTEKIKHQVQEWILLSLEKQGEISNTIGYSIDGVALNQLEVLGVLNALKSRNMIVYETLVTEKWILTQEGQNIAEVGSHEARVFHAVPAGEGISIPELTVMSS
jgi:phenylalanyl-tRNA synthetase alpha chain